MVALNLMCCVRKVEWDEEEYEELRGVEMNKSMSMSMSMSMRTA